MKKTFSSLTAVGIIFLFSFNNLSCSKIDTENTAYEDSLYVVENYNKYEYQIPMRDGVKLFTSVYVPKDGDKYPIMLNRTPYNVRPYGKDEFKPSLGPSIYLQKKNTFLFIRMFAAGL